MRLTHTMGQQNFQPDTFFTSYNKILHLYYKTVFIRSIILLVVSL